MKRIVIMLIAASMMATSVPVFAAEMMTKEAKDQCLLASKDCKNQVDSIQMKIKKLNTEIKKGTKVYSADEINKLNAKLKEAEAILDDLMKQ